MTEAIGIHDHPTQKLGRRPERTDRPKVPVGSFLRASAGAPLPSYPVQDPKPAGLTFPMDHNDQVGDCVVAGLDHALQVIHTVLEGSYTNWTDEQLLAAYQTQNPGFTGWGDGGGPNDGGMVIADFLDWCIKQGHILAYGKIDHTNQAEMEAAIYVGLAVVTGESLQQAQQSGTTWDYVAGSPDWGGHCTVWDGYFPPVVITWGSDGYTMTEAFVQHQVDEAYFILTQAHVDHPGFRDAFDLEGFAAAVSEITGGKVVVPVTPPPSPNPPPSPTGGSTFHVSDAVAAKVDHVAAAKGVTPDAWLDRHLSHYFHVKETLGEALADLFD